MTEPFIDKLCAAIASCRVEGEARRIAGRAVADTIGVAAAGFLEPVAIKVETLFSGISHSNWSGTRCDGPQSAALINAIAAHALDFDDLFVGASVHPSSVILPALLSDGWPLQPDLLIDAYCAGLLAARAISRRVGRGHRRRGFHGSSVFGVLAAAAAVGRRNGLGPEQLRSALALAAAQAGGMQINFGTMAKPSQVGFAAAAGYRAARMAEAGIDGAPDIFVARGFADLYGEGDGPVAPDEEVLVSKPELLALKLYPCCYGAHRMIGLAMAARERLGADSVRDPTLRFEVIVPTGSMKALRYGDPKTGLEAKFSGPHTVAIALMDGAPKIDHFTDLQAARPDLAAIRERITITQAGDPSAPAELTSGRVELKVRSGENVVAQFERTSLPGSPDDPPAAAAVRTKIGDCLQVFARERGIEFPMLSSIRAIPEVMEWLPD